MPDYAWFIVAVLAVWGLLRLDRARLMRKYGAEWTAYNAAAFKPQTRSHTDSRFLIVTRLAEELTSDKGQLAIVVACDGYRSTAIHHINKNGTFAAKGPYFISYRTQKWRKTGRRHVVELLRGTKGYGFKADHPYQDGLVWEKGSAILEYGTVKHRELTLDEFAWQRRRMPSQLPHASA